jgi:hypothetical protein
MRDEHEMVVMHLLAIEKQKVSPTLAEQRAVGRLLMPHEGEEINRDARILTGHV